MLSITLNGVDDLDEVIENLPPVVLAAVASKSAQLAAALYAQVEAKLHGGVLQSRSGALAASIAVDGPTITGDRVVTTLASTGDLKYAAIQEFGGVTSPHDILPVRAKALAFLAGGRQVFAKVVHHPGSRLPERSYLRSALAEMAADIDAGMKAAVLDALQQRLAA